MITGKGPIGQLAYIAVFDRILVNIVEVSPHISIGANTCIPIVVPDLAAGDVVPKVELAGGTAMKLPKKAGQVFAALCFYQDMVVVVQNNPGTQGKAKLLVKGLELFTKECFGLVTGEEWVVVERRGSDDVPGIVEKDMRGMVAGHGYPPKLFLILTG
jgi:hypothetical protein